MKRFFQDPILFSSIKVVMMLNSALLLGNTGIAVAEPTHVTASNDSLPLADDTYLYGETNQVNQIGQGYMVFRKQGQAVTGAFYYPQSELSCFTGKIENHRLSVLSLGFPHENAIAVEISLTKMHRISAVGNNELDSLSLCQREVAAYQKQQQIAAPVTQ